MPALIGRAPRPIGALLVIAAAMVVAACSAATEPPVSFDPNAPSLTASNQSGFDKTELDVPANVGFSLVLHNNDSVQHNVSIYSDQGHSQRVFGGEVANAGTHVYHVQALASGTYYFQCDIHPAMKGTLTAAGG
ncbi:MAG: cupredoxin domain-containing protein [Chloroflexi bacterium]|nr:cupredoxin domain-containing protein [Chloroflexota bacterium]